MALHAVGGVSTTRKPANVPATMRARDFIDEHLEVGICLDDLEGATGHDRWELSRDFRSLFGTSPSRYLTFRRLEQARSLMMEGQDLAAVAFASGFADQSHFTRHFKKTYGLTPRQWARSQAN